MKSIGIVRKFDSQGRIAIPSELRKTLHIEEGDPMEIFADEEGIYLRKHSSESPVKEALKLLTAEIKETKDLPNRTKIQKKLRELNELLGEE